MVTVSSAFISSRRERIIFSVLSALSCAFKAAALVEVLREVLADEVFEDLGKTDWDNTDVARDHSFHCIAGANLAPADHSMHVGLTVSISSTPTTSSCRPGSVVPWTTGRSSGRSGRPRPARDMSQGALPDSRARARARALARRARRARENFAEDDRSPPSVPG